MKYWGVNRVYSYSFTTFGTEWNNIETEKKSKIKSDIADKAKKFYTEVDSGKKHTPYLFISFMFKMSRFILKKYADETSLDKQYWIKKGWYSGEKSPF
ncbi:MAG: hypothetical protein K9L62_08805 [Vallitaleaceae bacterium]|nr:hypothetical protein [Vallitaleaceae bacterium]